MATQPNFSGRRLIIRVGDGASPEVFSLFCTFNGDRAIQFDSASTDEMDIDCDDPTAVAWTVTQVDSLSATVSGAGRVKAVDVPEFFNWPGRNRRAGRRPVRRFASASVVERQRRRDGFGDGGHDDEVYRPGHDGRNPVT
jgi:hypothetical protein